MPSSLLNIASSLNRRNYTAAPETIPLKSSSLPELREMFEGGISKHVYKLLRSVASSSLVSLSHVTEIVCEAFIANDEKFNAATALRWANNFSFPEEVYLRDNNKLIELGNDFPALVRCRQNAQKGDRLNLTRVNNLNIQQSEWKNKLLTIAEGIPIITAPGFMPSNIPPPLRKKYTDIAPAINKQIYELYNKGLIIILPTNIAKMVNGVHFSAVHWTAQHDKEQGRTLADPSSGSNPLNTPAAKEIVDQVCGTIEHPTLQTLMDMLINFGEEVGSFDDLLLWKRDLAGAFSLLDIIPEHVCLCAYELTDNLTMFYHSGFFGHLELPAMFNIINMVTKMELKLQISGCIEQYVDDIMAVSISSNVMNDMKIVGEFVENLLGPHSLNIKKDIIGRQIDWIGWGINLESMMVTISRKNLLKCIHGFFSVDVEKALSIKAIEKLASWSSRYSLIFQTLKPLSATLHCEHSGFRKRNIRKLLSEDAILVVWIWRSFLVLLAIHPDRYSRPIFSFKSKPTTFFVEFDASLEGLGIVISFIKNNTPTTYRVASIDTPFLLLGDSSYQNTMEFMAMVFSTCLVRYLGHRDVGIDFIGDSSSSLSWAKYERFKHGSSVSSALLFMRVTSLSLIKVNHITHVAGVNNVICDKLSRHHSPASLGFPMDQSISQENIPWMEEFFSICNPLLHPLLSHDAFLKLWTQLSLFNDKL